MHIYNPNRFVFPSVNDGDKEGLLRQHQYWLVELWYENGHYEYAQGIFHLLEEGLDTECIALLTDKIIRDFPAVMTQSRTSGQSVYAMRG